MHTEAQQALVRIKRGPVVLETDRSLGPVAQMTGPVLNVEAHFPALECVGHPGDRSTRVDSFASILASGTLPLREVRHLLSGSEFPQTAPRARTTQGAAGRSTPRDTRSSAKLA